MTNNNILIHNIYYMLAYAFGDFSFNMFEKIDGENFDNIYNLFAEILIRSVTSLLKQGLYKTYVNQEGVLSVMRGRINMLKTYAVQRNNPYHAYCSYDELTENNPYNQVIKATLLYLVKCSDVDEIRKQGILKILRSFVSIDPIDMQFICFERFCFDCNNQNYQMIINICRLIFENKIMTTEKGDYKLYTLSDDQMAKLYEKFVLAYYRRHHPETKPRVSKIHWNCLENESTISILPEMRTDITLSLGERTLIIETKYYKEPFNKYYGKTTIRPDHIRQIYTYVTQYDKEGTGKVDGMLLYAKAKGNMALDEKETLSSGNTIYLRTLDLNQNFKEIVKQLEAIIN